MNIKFIPSENPRHDQWRMLLQYSYRKNIERYFNHRDVVNVSLETVEYISGSILQAESYFQSSALTSLHIKPLLMYYGTVNLLAAVAALKLHRRLNIENHGMKLVLPSADGDVRIADVMVRPINPSTGALQQLANIFSNDCDLCNGATWTIEELLGSVPDLRIEYENCYPNAQPYTIPVEIVKTRIFSVERITIDALSRFQDVNEVFTRVPDFNRVYLPPQVDTKYVFLRKRMNANMEIGINSISGRKYLQISHLKHGQQLSPSLPIIMLMGLYALGVLSRYHPEIWNPFVRSDSTGERLLIERFLDICHRHLPNLALNAILECDVRFVNERDGIIDLSSSRSFPLFRQHLQSTYDRVR